MHAAALLTTMVAHGLIMPPVERYGDGPEVNATQGYHAIYHLSMSNRGVLFTKGVTNYDVPRKNRCWTDGNLFKDPLPSNLGWSGFTFCTIPEGPDLRIDIIDCRGEKEAKEAFLYLRMRRIPDYARSGRFLVKASPVAFGWFAKTFGAERYEIKRAFKLWGYWITN